MNNFSYSTQNPEKIAEKIEEILRKDLGLNEPIKYKIGLEQEAGSIASSILETGFTVVFGGKEKTLFVIFFEIAEPRPIKIFVEINIQGIGCHTGSFVFSTHLEKPVTTEVSFEEPKTFGTSKFTGDSTAIEKLNANKDLLKLADKFAKVKTDIGDLRMPRFVKIIPAVSGSDLMIKSFGKLTSMGFGATT